MQSKPLGLLAVALALAEGGCSSGRRATESDAGPGADAGGDAGDRDASAGCGVTTYLRYDQPGADGAWATQDDPIAQRQTWHFTDLLRVESRVTYVAAGADGDWETADDVIGSWYRYDHDEEATQLVLLWFSAPGPNGAWLDDDDTVYQRIVLDGYDGTTYTGGTAYGDPGADETWATADDVIVAVYEAIEEEGRTEERIYGAGPDGQFRTADDAVQGLASFGPKEDGAFLVIYYAPGPDGAFATQDDVVAGVLVVQCDYGVLTGFGAAGPDGAWETADDVVSYRLALSRGVPCASLCQDAFF